MKTKDINSGWPAPGGLTMITIAGRHFGLFTKPAVNELARQLQDTIAAAQGKSKSS